MKIEFGLVIEGLELLDKLRDFDPIVIGTPPLDMAVDDSDIDIACSSHNLGLFKKQVTDAYGTFDNFQIREANLQQRNSVIAQFRALDWEIELFCQSIPTAQQWGVRHFRIEQRLLELMPNLRPRIRQLKKSGLKTEPAFAQLLGLTGDPYQALLDLEHKDDDELLSLLGNT